jgi:hypothetical protein
MYTGTGARVIDNRPPILARSHDSAFDDLVMTLQEKSISCLESFKHFAEDGEIVSANYHEGAGDAFAIAALRLQEAIETAVRRQSEAAEG